MTFSLVARCARTGQVGVGAVTAMRGVGKLVCHAQAGVGAVATQATMNPYYGYDGLRMMSDGESAQETLSLLVSRDPGRDLRQCGMVDLAGNSEAWTGSRTPDWSGHLNGEGYSAQGNRLVGPETLEAVVDTFYSTEGEDLVERLLRALEAGEATGADKEGAISSNITILDTEEYPLWDLRVDHAGDAVAELRRLYEEFSEHLLPVVLGLPTRQDPLGPAAREAGAGAV